MINIVIQKSHNNKKKYDAVIDGTRTISFGAAGYEDYTTHKDTQRKSNYIRRHSKEDWSRSNLESPAWLSRYILWENLHYKKLSVMLTQCIKMLSLI